MALGRFLEGTAFGVLNDVLSMFHSEDGYAQPNRFEVLIMRPGSSASESRQVSMRCESINLPGRNLNSATDSNIYGPTREIVNGVTYAEDLTMTFQAGSGLEERVFFEEWQGMIFNDKSWEVRFYKEYEGDILITQLNRKEMPTYKIKLYEAFPKIITQQELGWNMNDNYQTLSVELMFHNWKSESIGN